MTTALIVGRFEPVHSGHVFLYHAALDLADRVVLALLVSEADTIPAERRTDWVRELFPGVEVFHVGEQDDLKRVEADLVVGADDRIRDIASLLGVRPVIVDPDLTAVEVSSNAVRSEPAAYWHALPPVVRAFYARRVCVFGPESTGKTTLVRMLANHYGTCWMPEYGRQYEEFWQPETWTPAMMREIGEVHEAMRRSLMRQANRVLIEDTDALITAIWSDRFAGGVDPWFEKTFELADLYLVTDIDVPWVDDGMRQYGEAGERRRFLAEALELLEARQANYRILSGDWAARDAAAVAAVDELLAGSGLHR